MVETFPKQMSIFSDAAQTAQKQRRLYSLPGSPVHNSSLHLSVCVSETKTRLLNTVSTLWPGHAVHSGSAARDYSMQCDRPSHLLRVIKSSRLPRYTDPVTHGLVHLLVKLVTGSEWSHDAQRLIVLQIKFPKWAGKVTNWPFELTGEPFLRF